MLKEIGSDFWKEPAAESENIFSAEHKGFERRFVLSGRTAEDLIVRDIAAKKKGFSVYMMSYCCHTMIEPFLNNGAHIEFYNTYSNNGKINFDYDDDNNCDAVFLMNYFGYNDSGYEEKILAAKKRNKIVILDRTHMSFLSLTEYEKKADYIFMSPRKWMFANSAVAMKNGEFIVSRFTNINEGYINLREFSAEAKKQYLFNGVGDKNVFLDSFAEAEERLSKDYADYAADKKSVDELVHYDLVSAIKQRRENAMLLTAAINEFDNTLIKPIFTEIKDDDVPLFVPVCVKPSVRARFRQYLISNRIYCPVHWPLSEIHPPIKSDESLYNTELSLICDQRYDNSDINRMIKIITEFSEDL